MSTDAEWQEQHEQRLAKDRPTDLPTLFHYTSVESALSILQSGILRLSAASSMNDASEGRWLTDRLTHTNAREAEDPGFRMRRETVLDLALRNGPNAYVACFSNNGDVLSQWRAYGSDGRGVAIGFNANDGRFPVVTGLPVTTAAVGRSCTINEVQYLTDGGTELARLQLDAAARGDEKEGLQVQLWISTQRWIVKNAAFAEEKEWRIVNTPLDINPSRNNGVTALSAVGDRQFRTAGGRLVSFYDMEFQKDAVTEVKLGPQCDIDLKELDMLFRDLRLHHATTGRSKATYRS